MRILVAGDIHGFADQCEYLAFQARNFECDRIVVLGDFGFWEHMPAGEEFLDETAVLGGEYGIDWYVIDGNHDKISLVLQRYQPDDRGFHLVRPGLFYASRGHRWTWDGVRIIALGGAYSVDKEQRLLEEKAAAYKIRKQNQYRPADRKRSTDTSGTQWFPEEEMTDEDMARILVDTTPVDIMLAHDKPRSSNPCWNRKDLPECWPNQDRLQLAVVALQPKLYLHGHLHYRYRDTVRTGGDSWCRVEGLDCDPRGHRSVWPRDLAYDRANSWLVLELSDGQFEVSMAG